MLFKIITLFLVAMAVLAMFGRLRLGRGAPRKDLPRRPRKCPDCGGFIIGKGPCGCRKTD